MAIDGFIAGVTIVATALVVISCCCCMISYHVMALQVLTIGTEPNRSGKIAPDSRGAPLIVSTTSE
jgi:hypothetical protein